MEGKFFKIIIIGTIIILTLLSLNPIKEDFKDSLFDMIKSESETSNSGNNLSKSIKNTELLIVIGNLRRNNYLIFSDAYVNVDGNKKVFAYGFLNMIWIDKSSLEKFLSSFQKNTSSSIEEKKNNIISSDAYQHGIELVTKSDCLTCHKVREKNIGPSFLQISEKYDLNDENVSALVSKVIHGGAGNWGQIPMTPHVSLKESDAKSIVEYILSLKYIRKN